MNSQAFSQQQTRLVPIPLRYQSGDRLWMRRTKQTIILLPERWPACRRQQGQLQHTAPPRQFYPVMPTEHPRPRLRQARLDPFCVAFQKAVDIALRQTHRRIDHNLASRVDSQRQAASTTTAAQAVRGILMWSWKWTHFFAA
jgi:hypothetical protein